MAEDNLQVVARIFDSWEAGDFSVGLDDLDPNVTFVVASPFPEPGILVGPRQISEYMLTFLAQFEPGSHTIRAERLRPFGDTVLVDVVQRGTGRTSGAQTELHFFMLFTFRGRRIVRFESVAEARDALEAVGVSE